MRCSALVVLGVLSGLLLLASHYTLVARLGHIVAEDTIDCGTGCAPPQTSSLLNGSLLRVARSWIGQLDTLVDPMWRFNVSLRGSRDDDDDDEAPNATAGDHSVLLLPKLSNSSSFFLQRNVTKPIAASSMRRHYASREEAGVQHKVLAFLSCPPNVALTADFDHVRRLAFQAAKVRGNQGATLAKEQAARCLKEENTYRKFYTSERKDFVGFVNEELLELGLCPSRGSVIDFYMGEQFESENAPLDPWAYHFSKSFKENSAIGAVAGVMDVFGSKDSYAHLFWKCKDLLRDDSKMAVLCTDAWLPSFNVNGDEYNLKKKVLEKEIQQYSRLYSILSAKAKSAPSLFPLWWIVKPQKGTYISRGMHISLLKASEVKTKTKFKKWVSDNVIDEACSAKGSTLAKTNPIRCGRRRVTFQQYVNTPALINKRKFDVRMWLIITSINPLRVFILRHGYPKISSRPFSEEKSQDQCVHIRMMLDPECNESVVPKTFLEPFEHGYPGSTASPVFHEDVEYADSGLPEDSTWADREDFFSEKIWPALEESFTKLLMLTRPTLLREERESKDKARRRDKKPAELHRRFALLSPDITISSSGEVFVEEINTNGMIMGTHQRGGGFSDLFHDADYIRHFLQILGADGFPRKAEYSEKLEKAIRIYCGAIWGGCDDEVTAEIRQAVHEEAHAGYNWYRLYPPIPCFDETNCEDGTWPEQSRVKAEWRAGMEETHLDTTVRQFLEIFNTQEIHGEKSIPGHGRWMPRNFKGTFST